MADLIGRILISHCCSALAGFRILQRQCVLHPELDMLPQGINADCYRNESLGGRHNAQHPHAGKHNHGPCLIETLSREHIAGSKNKHEKQTRQLPKEFRDAAVELRHHNNFSKVVVYDALIDSISETKRQQ